VTDKGSGVKSVLINKKSQKIKKSYTIKKAGRYTITVKDKAGNKATYKLTIDKTKPTVKGVKNNGSYNKAVTIKFSDNKNGSGIKKATLNGKTIKSGKKVSANGTYTLNVTDKAGNKTTVKFTIDKTKQTVTDKNNNETYTDEETPFTATVTSKTYIYDDYGRIIGAVFTGTASDNIDTVVCGTANADAATIKDKSFSITTYFDKDKNIKLLVCSTSDKSVYVVESLTDVSSVNDPINAKLYQDELDDITDDTEDVVESEDFDVSVSGIPEDNTVEVGQTITFTIKSNIASKINALGQNSNGYVTEFTVSATENGFVTYTLVSEKGNEYSDTVYVGCFKSNEQSGYMDAW
jgi:hypothetical protein